MKTIISILGLLLLGAAIAHTQTTVSSIDPISATVIGPNLISISVPSQPAITPQVISIVPDVTQIIMQQEAARPIIAPPSPLIQRAHVSDNRIDF